MLRGRIHEVQSFPHLAPRHRKQPIRSTPGIPFLGRTTKSFTLKLHKPAGVPWSCHSARKNHHARPEIEPRDQQPVEISKTCATSVWIFSAS